MGKFLGVWGVTEMFQVNSEVQHTFSDFSREVAGRWAEHELFMQKPKLEFLGPELETHTYNVTVSAYQGMPPRRHVACLERACRNGEWKPLFIGGTRVGDNYFILEKITELWTHIDSDGRTLAIDLELTFREYIL